MRQSARVVLMAGAVLTVPVAPLQVLNAQDLHIPLPVDSIEVLLSEAPFEMPEALVGTRFEQDRTQRVDLAFGDGTTVFTKWAAAPRGGGWVGGDQRMRDEEFNNSPRYEIAAYELQKLFLDEAEYVVPPTVARAVPLDWYRTLDERIDQTFGDAASVLVVLQFMVNFVTDSPDVFDPDRFASDLAYARHWANTNLFTHFIWHSDSNVGNLLISGRASNPRIFSVDNGVAFDSEESNRGTRWRSLQVDRFPATTVERLRGLTEEQLRDTLGVLVQYAVSDGELVRVERSENVWPERGVREVDGVIQLGLTEDEIDDVWGRIEAFLEDVDRGRFTTF